MEFTQVRGIERFVSKDTVDRKVFLGGEHGLLRQGVPAKKKTQGKQEEKEEGLVEQIAWRSGREDN